MDINALREFVAVARNGSFAKAATALAAPKSTVSKRLQDLEAALGVRLVERTTRQLRLTAEGAALLPRAERILADAREAERVVTSARAVAEGHLRIRMPSLFAQAFAGKIIADCRAAYPGIMLEIVVLDRPVDLMAEGFDSAIVVGQLGDSGQAARVIAETETYPVAAPSLIARYAMPCLPGDLGALPAVTMNSGAQAPWVLSKDGQSVKVEVRSVASVNSMTVLKDAALAGAGIAYPPAFLVKEHVESGALLRLLPEWEGARVPVSLVYPSTQSVTSRLRAFIDILVAQFPDRNLPEMRGRSA